MLVIGQCNRTVKGQLTHHACVSGQCNRTVKGQLTHHACVSGKNCNCFFFWKYITGLISFSNFVIVLINW